MIRSKKLQQRRNMLITECTIQRATLVAQIDSLASDSSLIKLGCSLIKRAKYKPIWVASLLAGLAACIPKRAASLARNGLLLWQIWQTFSSQKNTK